MPIAIKKDFRVKKGVEAPSLKIGTQEVTSLLDSSSVATVVRSPTVAKQIMNDGGATSKIYDSPDLLPSAGNDSGDFAYVYSTNRLYLWNGSGWYNIALINTAPSISGADSSYSLASALNSNTITALQVTLTATDPEGLPITFSAEGSDSASSFVDITQDSSVITITPKNRTALASGDSAGGNFSITFKASDGTFIAPLVSSFTLQFPESFALFALSEIQKLQSNDIAAGDEFGQDVALSDQANYAIVGAWKEDEKASDAGAAYIFAKSGNSLVQQAKLMASDGTSSDSFGYSVDINKTGTYAIVGAKAADPSSAGAAYIFTRSGTTWTQQAKLSNSSSPSSGDWYGVSVAISNDGMYAIVGSHNKSSGTGAAYVYIRSGTSWSLQQELVRSPSNSGHYYGYSVDIDDDGNTVVVGSYGNNKAYVWTRSGTTWTQQQQIAGSQAVSTNEYFGRSVSISEDGLTVLVGAEREAHSGTTKPGAGYIFKYGTANYQVANATHDHSSPAISQDTQPSACLFNGDGTKVFVFGYQNDKIYQYNLSTAYDVSSSSMSYASGSDITLSDFSGDPSGARWNNDGTKLFIIDKTNDQLHQYTLSTAYDLSTLSYNGYASVGEATTAFGFDFNSDGTKVFVVDRSNDRIYQYTMGTAYDYSTLSYDSVYTTTTDGNTDPFSITFNSTGTRYFVTDDDSTARVHIYECAIPYDLSDVEHIGTFAVNSQELYPKQITFSPSGDKMFLVGNDADKIQRYDVQTTNSWYQEARLQQSDAGYQDWMGSKASISGDGTAAVLGSSYAQRPGIGDGFGEMRIFTRSTTGVWSEAGLRQASDWEYMDRFGLGVSISPDGRYVLVGAPQEDTNGSNAGKAYFYKAPQNQFTFPWQPTSGTETKIEGQVAGEYFGYSVALDQYGDRAAIGAQYGNFGGNNYTGVGYVYGRSGSAWSQQARLGPSDGVNGDRFGTGVALSLDGNTAAFGAYLEDPENRTDAGSVYVYDGSVTASYNISAASYTQSTPALNSQTTNPVGLTFNSDGTKMFVLTNNDNGKLVRYSLSTAYDISTASHDGSSNDKYINQAQSGSGNVNGINNPGELRIKSDGAVMFVSDYSDNKIYAIALSTAWDFNGNLWSAGFFDPNAQLQGVTGFDLSPDGTKLIIVSSSSNVYRVWEYTLSTAWTMSSSNITYANRYYNLNSDGISQPQTVAWKADGNGFVVACSTTDKVYEYNLNNSSFELSGVTLQGSLDISTYETSINCLTFDKQLLVPNSTGAKMYIMGGGMTDDKVHEYSTRGPVWSQTAKTFGGTASSQHFGQSIDLNSDGTIMAVGAPNENYETTGAGAVYVMKKQINYQVMDMTHLNFTTVNSDNNDTTDMAFNSNGTKLYHTGVNTNRVVEYDLSTAYDVSTKTYNSVNFLPSAGGYNTGIRWKPDGTKIFVLSHTNNGGGTATVHRYDVSTPYDLSTVTATAEQTYDARDYLNRAWGFTFKPDGTKMFISDDNGNDINEFSLSTAWDLTTVSYVTNFSVSSQESQPSGLEFNADGKILYMSGFNNDRIYKYNLSTAYDISTMGYSSEYISVSGESSQPGGIKFQPDGSKLFLACISSNGVDTYDTSGVSYENVSKPTRAALVPNGQTTQGYSYMGWDVAMNSSATRMIAGAYKDGQSTSNAGAAYIFTGDGTGSFTVEAKLRPPTSPSPSSAQFGHSVDITEDGNTVVIGSKSDNEKGTQTGSATIYNRLPPEYYAVEDFTHLGFYSLTDGGVSNVTDIAWNSDGTKFFSIAYSGDKVNEYSVSTAYDVSTKTYVRQFDLSSQTNYPTGITFNTDGTKMFITHPTGIGGGTNGLFQYNLTTGFDLSTASYANIALSRDSYTNDRAWGVSFKPDGTKMFISDDGGDDIRQFTLSTPFDLSTISSYDSSTDLYVGSQDSSVRGHAFNGDGTKLYVVGDQNDRIYIYNLSTAYDVSTGSYDTYKSLSSQTNNPSGIKFNPDGSKMWISCIQSEGVDQYSVIKQDWDSGYKIFHPDPTNTDYFGVSVSISGDGKTVSVGCERDDTKASNAGAVLVYHRGEEGPTNNGTGSNYLNGNGTSVGYHHVKTITASDGVSNDYLSAGQDRAQALEMSKNGEYIIAGTYRADPNSLSNAGKTYIFKNT